VDPRASFISSSSQFLKSDYSFSIRIQFFFFSIFLNLNLIIFFFKEKTASGVRPHSELQTTEIKLGKKKQKFFFPFSKKKNKNFGAPFSSRPFLPLPLSPRWTRDENTCQ
jgi:hypothetical protein